MIAEGIDWDQVVALAAPRKFLFCTGGKDEGTPEPMIRAFVNAINRRCREEKLPQSVWVCKEPEVGHKIMEKMMNRAVLFFRTHLTVNDNP